MVIGVAVDSLEEAVLNGEAVDNDRLSAGLGKAVAWRIVEGVGGSWAVDAVFSDGLGRVVEVPQLLEGNQVLLSEVTGS